MGIQDEYLGGLFVNMYHKDTRLSLQSHKHEVLDPSSYGR